RCRCLAAASRGRRWIGWPLMDRSWLGPAAAWALRAPASLAEARRRRDARHYRWYLIEHPPHVDHLAGDGRRGHHCRTHEQGAARRTSLASFEVTVRRRRADLAAFEAILVHAEA